MFVVTKQSICNSVDYYRDVRSAKDVKNLLSSCKLIQIDYQDNLTLKDILNELVKSTFPIDSDERCYLTTYLEEIINNGKLESIRESIDSTSNWIIYYTSVPKIKRRLVMIGTFDSSINLGNLLERVSICCLILCPEGWQINYKSPLVTATSIATLFTDKTFRVALKEIHTQNNLTILVDERVQCQQRINRTNELWSETLTGPSVKWLNIFSGVKENITRRSKVYLSDWTDGLTDAKTISKVISSAIFLYFLCLLPTLAFGVLNSKNTLNKITPYRAILGEAVGGIVFSLISGQPFVIIATTAPIALCNLIVADLSTNLNVDFYTLYAYVGIFNSIFLITYGLLGLASFISYSTRSIEEIFSLFIVIAFVVDALHDPIELINSYNNQNNSFNDTLTSGNEVTTTVDSVYLYILLLIGTLWLAVILFNFKFSLYSTSIIRDSLSDYALPISVIIFSIIGKICFSSVYSETYNTDPDEVKLISLPNMTKVNGVVIIISIILGFAVSLLFYMDQGVSAELVDSPNHNLTKGNANDLDFITVGIINLFLSLLGLPWMHGLLPHSPLHVQSLADYEEKILPNGTVDRVIVKVRETRLATLIAHILILLTIIFIPKIFSLIPVAVLNGLFLYCAVASLRGNSFYERIILFFTDPTKFPSIHYIRKCPTKQMHTFTFIQLIQLTVLVFIGYAPWAYLRMTFPLFIAALIPIRHILIPKLVGDKFATALDSYN